MDQSSPFNEYDNLKLIISDSGKLASLICKNGRVIFEILVHGNLKKAADNATYDNPIASGYTNIFRGDLYQLASYEILDKVNECIREK